MVDLVVMVAMVRYGGYGGYGGYSAQPAWGPAPQPRQWLQNLDSQNHGYMAIGNTGLNDRALFAYAADGGDVFGLLYGDK